MNFKNEEIGLNIEITETLLEKIRIIGLKHYPKEFGGIFIGNYSQDKKTVVLGDTLLPKKYKSSKYSFERGSEGLREKLIKLFNQEKSQLYVGEWHTHPDSSAIPSVTDVAALNEIVQHDEVNICNPIMLIVGLTLKETEFGFYVYFKNKIYKYETV